MKRYSTTGTTSPVASSDFTWDRAGRLETLDHRTGSTPGSGTQLAGYGYTWNQREELTAINFLPAAFNGEDVTYTYDARSQLASAVYTTQSGETYQWDDAGNRTNGGFGVGTNNRLTTDGTYTYTYDAEGNIVLRTKASGTDADGTKTREFAWDHRNRLVKVTSKNTSGQETSRVEYNYDAEDHLIRRRVFLSGSGTPSEQRVFVYDDGQVALQFDRSTSGNLATADLNHRYLWGPAVDQLLADEDLTNLTSPGTVLWPLTDHLGTVRDWINSSGAVLDHVEYDSFGRRVDTTVAVDAAFGWTGRYRDPLTGLQYNDARWYNPAIGRTVAVKRSLRAGPA